MTDMTKWNHKSEWRQFRKDCMVVVSHHTEKLAEEPSGCYDAEGPNRWCVYAWFYRKHPRFLSFSGPSLFQPATAIGIHGGCSLLRYHRNDAGEVTAVQVGADYNHLHDWKYTQHATPEDAYQVFEDAEQLFQSMALMGAVEPEEVES